MNSTPPTTAPETGVARPASPPRFPFTLMFLIWLAVVLVATLVTFMLPEQFVSSARIKVERDQAVIRGLGEPSAPSVYDPHFIQTEVEIIRSELILTSVVETLKLSEVWGKRYNFGERLKARQTMDHLRSRLDVRAVPNTSLVDIFVYGDQPEETAILANQIAESYRLWRQNHATALVVAGIEALAATLKVHDQKMNFDRKQLAGLPVPLETAPPFDDSKFDYLAKQKQLAELVELRGMLNRRISIEKMDLQLPRIEQVMLIESARASAIPMYPDKAFNIWLSVLLGGISGLLLATLVFLLQRRVHQKKSGIASPINCHGLRTVLRVTIALVVGVLVGYSSAQPTVRDNFYLIQLFVFLGGVGFVFVELSKPTPQPLPPRAPAEPQEKVSP